MPRKSVPDLIGEMREGARVALEEAKRLEKAADALEGKKRRQRKKASAGRPQRSPAPSSPSPTPSADGGDGSSGGTVPGDQGSLVGPGQSQR